MAQFIIMFEIPDIAREFLTTTDLNPFETNLLSIKMDSDEVTKLTQQLLQAVRYQKQRDNETFSKLHVGGIRAID